MKTFIEYCREKDRSRRLNEYNGECDICGDSEYRSGLCLTCWERAVAGKERSSRGMHEDPCPRCKREIPKEEKTGSWTARVIKTLDGDQELTQHNLCKDCINDGWTWARKSMYERPKLVKMPRQPWTVPERPKR